MSGLGSLVQGFQQGYSFVDDAQRNAKNDAWAEKERAHKERDWQKADDYEAERAALAEKYFPKEKKDAEPARTTGAALAVQQGAVPPPGGAVGAVAAPDVATRPLDGSAPTAAPLTVADTGAAVAMPPPAPLQAGAGRGFVNPAAITAADRSVAPGKVDLARMSPDQKQNLMALAEKQFGLRHRPATPAEEAANQGGFVNASMPAGSPVPGAKMAVEGVDTPTNTTASKTGNLNHMLDFALESAKLDVKHGKMDGAGILSVVKATETLKREGMDRATALMGQGRFQEAQDLMNSQGDHVGITIVSSKDATFKVGKIEVPTKIVTMRKEDGTTSTVNTAQAQYQMMGMEKQIETLQKDRTADITEKHYDAVLNEQKLARQDRQMVHQDAQSNSDRAYKLEKQRYDDSTVEGKIEQVRKALGPLKPEEEREYRKKLMGIGKDTESRQKFYEETVKEGVKAGTIKTEDAGKTLTRLMQGDKVADDEGIVSKELISNKGDPAAYAKSYEMATKIMPPARLKELGFEPPKPQKPAGTGAKLAATAGPESASRVPDPPPQFIQTGLSRMANPAYADWAKNYADAYGKQQSQKDEGRAVEKKRADAYNPFQQPKL